MAGDSKMWIVVDMVLQVLQEGGLLEPNRNHLRGDLWKVITQSAYRQPYPPQISLGRCLGTTSTRITRGSTVHMFIATYGCLNVSIMAESCAGGAEVGKEMPAHQILLGFGVSVLAGALPVGMIFPTYSEWPYLFRFPDSCNTPTLQLWAVPDGSCLHLDEVEKGQWKILCPWL